MVERMLSMHEAKGSIPLFSNPFCRTPRWILFRILLTQRLFFFFPQAKSMMNHIYFNFPTFLTAKPNVLLKSHGLDQCSLPQAPHTHPPTPRTAQSQSVHPWSKATHIYQTKKALLATAPHLTRNTPDHRAASTAANEDTTQSKNTVHR